MKIQDIRRIFQIAYLILLFTTYLVSLKLFLLFVLISTIMGGVFFCGWMCPFGTMQEVTGNIAKALGIPRMKIPKKMHRYLLPIRYALFGLFFIGVYFMISFDARISFLDILDGQRIPIFSYLVVTAFIVSSIFIDRLFCSYLCIQGARYGLFSTFRIFRIKRDKETCINCGICDSTCPMNISISDNDSVNSLQCINCFKCLNACPKEGALKYSILNKVDLKKILDRFRITRRGL